MLILTLPFCHILKLLYTPTDIIEIYPLKEFLIAPFVPAMPSFSLAPLACCPYDIADCSVLALFSTNAAYNLKLSISFLMKN